MAKYIIDVAKEWVDITKGLHIPIEKCLNLGDLRIDTGLEVTPYIEPGEQALEKATHEGRLIGKKEGVEEAWEFFMKCLKMDGNDFYDIFDSCDALCLTNLSYQEAKTKYDEWKKEKEQIRVGDEVIIKSDGTKGVVLDEDLCGEFSVFTENGCCEAYRKIHFEKTGRHLEGVEKLLEEMRSDS